MKAKKALKRLNKVESLLSNPSDETGIRTSGSVDPRLNVSVKAPRAVSLKRRTERSFAAPRLKPPGSRRGPPWPVPVMPARPQHTNGATTRSCAPGPSAEQLPRYPLRTAAG